MNTITNVITALAIIATTGCATTTTPTASTTSPIASTSTASAKQNVCSLVSDFVPVAHEGRRKGLTKDAQQKLIALAAYESSGGKASRSDQMTGTLMYMALKQVYEDPARTQAGFYADCMADDYPMAAFLAASGS